MSRPLVTACAIGALASSGAAQTVFFDFFVDGTQEVPPSGSFAFGFATLAYDQSNMTFDLDVFVDGIDLADLTSSPAHLHNAPMGQNGPIVVDLGAFGSFEEDVDNQLLQLQLTDVPIGSAETEAALFAGELYLNIHTSDFPGGEIRGQVVPAPAGALAMTLLGARRRRRA